MKKLLTLALLILAYSAHAQVPDYFSDNPEWRQDWWFGGAMPCLEIYNYVYYLNGDSVVGNYTYKKVFKRGKHEYNWMAPPPSGYCNGSYFYNFFYVLIRQDSLKVYIREGNNNEALLYDFDLAVGDTLPETYFLMEDDIVVTSIDSILVGESYRKVFSLSCECMISNLLIEGIGFGEGFLEYFPDWEFPARLICFALNGITYYPSYGAPCDLMTVNINEPEIKDIDFEVFPNPSAGNISVKLYSDEKTTVNIKVSDISGRNLSDEKWVINQRMNVKSLDLSSFDKGIYFISIIGKDGESKGRQTIIVN